MKSTVYMLSVSATLGASGGFTSCGDPTQGPVNVFSCLAFYLNLIFYVSYTQVLDGIDVVDAFRGMFSHSLSLSLSQSINFYIYDNQPSTAAQSQDYHVPVKGSEEFVYKSDEGFEFWFSSQDNLKDYESNPDDFPIGAGGYCGLAVSGGDPACDYEVCQGPACVEKSTTYEIANGKLYFFLGDGAMKIFNQDKNASATNCEANVLAVQNATGITCYNTDKFMCHGH